MWICCAHTTCSRIGGTAKQGFLRQPRAYFVLRSRASRMCTCTWHAPVGSVDPPLSLLILRAIPPLLSEMAWAEAADTAAVGRARDEEEEDDAETETEAEAEDESAISGSRSASFRPPSRWSPEAESEAVRERKYAPANRSSEQENSQG
jgi:hypothetical protein